MIKGFVITLIAGTLIAWAALSAVAGEAAIDWVSYCSGKVKKATVVDATGAKNMRKAKKPFCVVYREGFYDPLELSGACDEAAGKPLPWISTKSVDLLLSLPAGANAADYEVVVSVAASEAPAGCASCDPRPECEPGTQEVKKEFRLALGKNGEWAR